MSFNLYGIGKFQQYGRSPGGVIRGAGDFSLLRLSTFLMAITVSLISCGPVSQAPPLSTNQKIMGEVQRTISAANTMTVRFHISSVCGPVVHHLDGSALVSFADTLNGLIAEPGVLESPPVLFLDIYQGGELVEQLQMLEFRLLRHRGLDADMSFLAEEKIVQWFKRQSISIRCLKFDDK